MKAAVLHGNEDIRYEEIPTPKPGAGQVLVRVKATGICGSDIPRVLYNGAHSYPIVLGHEFSGIVEATGEGVTKVKVGDYVSGAPLVPCHTCTDCKKGNYSLCKYYSFIGSREQGSFADFVVMPEINAVKFDPSIPFIQAAMFEPSTVALHGLFCANYTGGGNVAVLGGGTIGMFTAQWAKIFGAKSITVFDIVDKRLELAKRLGADCGVNTLSKDFKPNTADYDFVFETAGNTITMQYAFELAANKASVCFIGTPHKDLTFSPKLWECMNRKEFNLTGSWMSYSAPFPGKEWELTAHYLASGQLKYDDALVYKTFPMSEAAEAFALYKIPGKVEGKIMLVND